MARMSEALRAVEKRMRVEEMLMSKTEEETEQLGYRLAERRGRVKLVEGQSSQVEQRALTIHRIRVHQATSNPHRLAVKRAQAR